MELELRSCHGTERSACAGDRSHRRGDRPQRRTGRADRCRRNFRGQVFRGETKLRTDNQILVRNVKPLTGSKISLPPGNYFLDVQDRVRKRVRTRPQPFTVVSNQIVRVDMNVVIGLGFH